MRKWKHDRESAWSAKKQVARVTTEENLITAVSKQKFEDQKAEDEEAVKKDEAAWKAKETQRPAKIQENARCRASFTSIFI